MVQHLQTNQCDIPHNKMNNKNYIIISTDEEKVFYKIQRLFMIKTLNKVGIERKLPYGPVVRTQRFHCCAPCSVPDQRTNILQAVQYSQ